jgi:hypothetical protein
MSRTIKRGPPPKRPAPRRKVAVKKVSVMDRLVGMLPVSEDTLRKIATWSILGAGGAVAIAAASSAAVAEGAGRAGFKVEQIEVTGLKRMDRMSVYAVALEDKQNQTSMLSVDLEAVRQKLLRYGWIADAHVSRRLPNTMLVDIVERTPAAVWQDNGQLTLIDSSGVLLEPVQPDAIPNLPLVIGPGADRQEASYQTCAQAAREGGDLGRQSPLGPDVRERRDVGAARRRCAARAGEVRRAGWRAAAARARLDPVRHARSDQAGRAQAGCEPGAQRRRAGTSQRGGERAGNRRNYD